MKFAVALSFPGEHRLLVEQIADILADSFGRERVFYDEWHKPILMGRHLDRKLRAIYRDQSELVVPFFSRHYSKPWCELEWSAIREILLLRRSDDCVTPIDLDGSSIDGWGANDFAASMINRSACDIADLIIAAYRVRHPQENISPRQIDAQVVTSKSALARLLELDELLSSLGLRELTSLGKEGEDFFLNSIGNFPRDCMVELRCLQYVWSRRKTIGPGLISVLQTNSKSARSMAAFLCQAMDGDLNTREEVFRMVHSKFTGVPNDNLSPGSGWWEAVDDGSLGEFMHAYGNLGGSCTWLQDWAQAASSAWKKTSTDAFRAACTSYAMSGEGGSYIRELINPRSPFDPIRSEETWSAAYYGPFAIWVRRDTMDELSTDWRNSSSPDARLFAARILAAFGPIRLESTIRDWQKEEKDAAVCSTLSGYLYDLEMMRGVGRFEIAATEAISGLVEDRETIVWLARRKVEASNIAVLSNSTDWYSRCCGLVASALLCNGKDEVFSEEMLSEATEPLEILFLTVAIVLRDQKDDKKLLICALERTCSDRYAGFNRLDLRHLQRLWRVIISETIERFIGKQSIWMDLLKPIKFQ